MWRVGWAVLMFFVTVGFAGCGGGDSGGTTEPPIAPSASGTAGPTADDPVAGESTIGTGRPDEGHSADRAAIAAWADEFAEITHATVSAWDSHDLDAIRRLYTEDVVHDDDRFSTYREGIDAVMGIAEAMFTHQTPDVRFARSQEFGDGFIGGDGGIMVWEAYEVFGYTRDRPLVEVDRLTIRDGLIAYWELLYETSNTHDLIAAYAPAWSSGDPAAVAALYGSSAMRDDAVLVSRADGLEALQAAAADFFDVRPGATWELLLSFGAGNTHGGLFAITDDAGCSVRVAVLTRIEAGKIVSEEVYYEAASLLACGWLF